jgi:hypothetical protein
MAAFAADAACSAIEHEDYFLFSLVAEIGYNGLL